MYKDSIKAMRSEFRSEAKLLRYWKIDGSEINVCKSNIKIQGCWEGFAIQLEYENSGFYWNAFHMELLVKKNGPDQPLIGMYICPNFSNIMKGKNYKFWKLF